MDIWSILGKQCHESVEVPESDPLLGIKEHVVVSNVFLHTTTWYRKEKACIIW